MSSASTYSAPWGISWYPWVIESFANFGASAVRIVLGFVHGVMVSEK